VTLDDLHGPTRPEGFDPVIRPTYTRSLSVLKQYLDHCLIAVTKPKSALKQVNITGTVAEISKQVLWREPNRNLHRGYISLPRWCYSVETCMLKLTSSSAVWKDK